MRYTFLVIMANFGRLYKQCDVFCSEELVAQVTKVCRSLSRTVPFRSVAMTGGRPWKTQKDFLKEGVDVLVGTPQRVLDHIREKNICLDKCKTVVLDEVDVLLGRLGL